MLDPTGRAPHHDAHAGANDPPIAAEGATCRFVGGVGASLITEDRAGPGGTHGEADREFRVPRQAERNELRLRHCTDAIVAVPEAADRANDQLDARLLGEDQLLGALGRDFSKRRVRCRSRLWLAAPPARDVAW